MRYCSKCGFPLGTRPGLLEVENVCMACINSERKKSPDFQRMFRQRQEWLTQYIEENKTHPVYDCVVAVSGGKDSHAIVKRLYENHGVKNALLVSVTDEFTHTEAGKHNINNLVTRYNCDHITFRCQPQTFKAETLKDFENELHPLKWIEEKIYSVPVEIAKAYGIKLVFFGENSAFEYGTSMELDIFHPNAQPVGEMAGEKPKCPVIVFMGAIYPYSIADSLEQARSIGFKDLDDFGEWKRQGSIDQFTQIDSIAYIIQLWTKYVKFGFQRVADIACRMVREGTMSKARAQMEIAAKDHIIDPMAKADFCQTIGITETHFDEVVAKHANKDIVEWRYGDWRVKE
jgi:hypothetical protein